MPRGVEVKPKKENKFLHFAVGKCDYCKNNKAEWTVITTLIKTKNSNCSYSLCNICKENE